MNLRFVFRTISLLVLLAFASSCSNARTTPASTQPAANTELPASSQATTTPQSSFATGPSLGSGSATPPAGSGPCDNAYYPVREGATWTYSSTGGPAGGQGFTDTVTSVRDHGFTLTSTFGDVTRTQEWECTPEGLVALQLGGASLAIFDPDKMQVNLDVRHVSGVTFPKEIQPGDTWQHTLEFSGTIALRGHDTQATGDAQSSFQAAGYEKVTVPAGSFDALKIHVDTTFHLTSNFSGLSQTFTFTTPYDYWFVKDVGWVKASGKGTVDDDSFSETIELQSYHIP